MSDFYYEFAIPAVVVVVAAIVGDTLIKDELNWMRITK